MSDRRELFAGINERVRQAFLAGAVEEWTRANRRPPTADELDRLPRRYPGDPMRQTRRDEPA